MSRIGLLAIATGKYHGFVAPLLDSVRRHFMNGHEVTMFVFTDGDLVEQQDTVVIPHVHEPWPNPTLKRYHVFVEHSGLLSRMDHLYYCDVDMRFVADVGDEILPDNASGLVATEHPGFYGGRRGTYETNPQSTAYMPPGEGTCYYAGGFNGGTSAAFLSMAAELKSTIDRDLNRGIIAVWHDESHMNKYLAEAEPKVLSPSYCYPESWDIPFEKKLLALEKNHEEMRS